MNTTTGMTPEDLARKFHGIYERLAPQFGYETRKETAVPWEDIPEDNNNKRLMIAVCGELLLSPMIQHEFANLQAQLTVTAKELVDLAMQYEKLHEELRVQIANHPYKMVSLVIDNWLADLGLEKTWSDFLHPYSVLDKHIFPALKERLDDNGS